MEIVWPCDGPVGGRTPPLTQWLLFFFLVVCLNKLSVQVKKWCECVHRESCACSELGYVHAYVSNLIVLEKGNHWWTNMNFKKTEIQKYSLVCHSHLILCFFLRFTTLVSIKSEMKEGHGGTVFCASLLHTYTCKWIHKTNTNPITASWVSS